MRTLSLLALTALLAAGCASQPSHVDANFGNAVNGAKAGQVVDPDAPLRQRPAPHQDGAAARSTIEQYEKSYQSPPPPATLLNIGVGTGSQPAR